MKLTIDHNVIIDLANGSSNVARLREIIEAEQNQVYVVEIGASEMRQRGIRPDRYDLFEELLKEAGISKLPRLMPMMIWNVTFWDHGIWSNSSMSNCAKANKSLKAFAALTGTVQTGAASHCCAHWDSRAGKILVT
jgi:hypothetical protein